MRLVKKIYYAYAGHTYFPDRLGWEFWDYSYDQRMLNHLREAATNHE